MKFLAISLLLATSAQAFDRGAWLERREVLSREAERLRAAYSNAVASADAPAEDVEVPLETNADGSIRLSISAKKSRIFLKEGLVWASGVAIRRFDEKGAEVSRVEAEECLFDRATKSGWAEGRAKVVHGGTAFSGEGVYFSAEEEYVMSFGGSRLETKDLGKAGKKKGGGA